MENKKLQKIYYSEKQSEIGGYSFYKDKKYTEVMDIDKVSLWEDAQLLFIEEFNDIDEKLIYSILLLDVFDTIF